MSEAVPPPPPKSGTPISAHSATMFRNVITGVITTVIGAGALYLLKFNKSGDTTETNFLVMKEATVNAWNSYVSSENSAYRNLQTYTANYKNDEFSHFKNGVLSEWSHYRKSLELLLEKKAMDPSLYSFLQKRDDALTELEYDLTTHLDKYYSILQSTSGDDQTKKLKEENSKFNNETSDFYQLFGNDIDELCKALTSKYGYTFSATSLLRFQKNQNNNNNNTTNDNSGGVNNIDRQKLVGSWKVVNDYMYQYVDGSFYLYGANGDSSYGTWSLNNDMLELNYGHYGGSAKTKFLYKIINQTDNSFVAQSTDESHYTFTATRVTSNTGTTTNNQQLTGINRQMLIGKWINGANTLYQYQDGKMYYYYSNGDSSYGTWQINYNQLYHYYNQYYGAGHTWKYNINNLTNSSMSITLLDSPYYRYNFVRGN
ncbi:MAG TPA: hypothetical protein VET23_11080 [Chitinophagaceae bacterium]|nr:hypothetical protein [Chitinophagaceae bacterium]